MVDAYIKKICDDCHKKPLEIEMCNIRRFRYQGEKAPCERKQEE